jgi:tRNA pseudouridine38-40 synthase
MTRWKLTLEYDGHGFAGWQRQADDVTTVQGVLEDAIRKFSREDVTLHVAGRTDAGVHALAQAAHVDLAKETDGETIRDALNFHVKPHLVSVLSATKMSDDFHARFSAKARSYEYHILNRRSPPALYTGYVTHVVRPLDENAMQRAAEILIGQHDFSTFRAANCQSNSPIKTLDHFILRRDNDHVIAFVKARSFLYHQVRNMMGTLILVGTGQWTEEEFKQAFAAKDRTKGGPTAPPEGLYFQGVTY